MTTPTEEVKKDSIHNTNIVVPGLDKYDFFTQEEKDKLEILVKDKIVEISCSRFDYESMLTLRKHYSKPEDDKKINQYAKVIEMYTKELEILENILKKINNDT